jgi:23S rRNA (cytosine1962-C5)-methyltransferase
MTDATLRIDGIATVALVDAGGGRRLERFGDRVVDRPHPGALADPLDRGAWSTADLRFDRGTGWRGRLDPAEPWRIDVAGLRLELRATESGGIGFFPEQLANVGWLEAQVRARASGGTAPNVLNLFAHTGLLTIVAATAGASVVHVDAARPAVAWARRNAELSGLGDRPIRWLIDDALGFVRREARRGRRYDGILLDPPSYGHAGRHPWRLETDLPELLAACAAVAAPGAFVLLTAHTTGYEGEQLAGSLADAFPTSPDSVEVVPLELVALSGARLRLGDAVRLASAHPLGDAPRIQRQRRR